MGSSCDAILLRRRYRHHSDDANCNNMLQFLTREQGLILSTANWKDNNWSICANPKYCGRHLSRNNIMGLIQSINMKWIEKPRWNHMDEKIKQRKWSMAIKACYLAKTTQTIYCWIVAVAEKRCHSLGVLLKAGATIGPCPVSTIKISFIWQSFKIDTFSII